VNEIKSSEIESIRISKLDDNTGRIFLKMKNESPYCSVILKSNSKEMLKEISL
jgi:hypothetical protein